MNILWYVAGRIIEKTAFCKCENKGTGQCFCFHYIYSTIISSFYIRFQASSHLLNGWPAGFVSNLVRNHKDRFSHDTAEVNLTLVKQHQVQTSKLQCRRILPVYEWNDQF